VTTVLADLACRPLELRMAPCVAGRIDPAAEIGLGPSTVCASSTPPAGWILVDGETSAYGVAQGATRPCLIPLRQHTEEATEVLADLSRLLVGQRAAGTPFPELAAVPYLAGDGCRGGRTLEGRKARCWQGSGSGTRTVSTDTTGFRARRNQPVGRRRHGSPRPGSSKRPDRGHRRFPSLGRGSLRTSGTTVERKLPWPAPTGWLPKTSRS